MATLININVYANIFPCKYINFIKSFLMTWSMSAHNNYVHVPIPVYNVLVY